MHRLGDLVEVPVTSDEEVKGQGQLGEGSARHALNERLIVDFEKSAAAGAREPDHVPPLQRDRSTAPEAVQLPIDVKKRFYVFYFGHVVLQCFDAVGYAAGKASCKKLEWWGADMVVGLEQGADLHTAQLMPLPLTISCSSKIQIGFYLSGTGSPG